MCNLSPLSLTRDDLPSALTLLRPRDFRVTLSSSDLFRSFLQENKLELLIRSHEVMDGGFEWAHNKQLLTVFSASDYCGVCENQGAIVCIDSDMHITCQQYKASDVENMPRAKYVQKKTTMVFFCHFEPINDSRFDPRRVQKETLAKLRERIFECSSALIAAFKKVHKLLLSCLSLFSVFSYNLSHSQPDQARQG